MSVQLVTYDLNSPGKDYTGLHKEIKRHDWARLSESSYAIDTDETVYQVYDRLEPFIDSNDHIYVITLTRPYVGYGPVEVNRWLENHLKSYVHHY